MKRKIACLVLLLALSLACLSNPPEARTYEGDVFSFTIPEDWQTREEVWGSVQSPGRSLKAWG